MHKEVVTILNPLREHYLILNSYKFTGCGKVWSFK